MAATDIGIPEDIRDIVKGSVTGMQQFVDADVLPMEREMGDILIDERKFFDETRQGPAGVMEARKQVRMKSAARGLLRDVRAGERRRRRAWRAEHGLRRGGALPPLRPRPPADHLGEGVPLQPTLASFVDGPSHMLGRGQRLRAQGLPPVDLQRREDGLLRA